MPATNDSNYRLSYPEIVLHHSGRVPPALVEDLTTTQKDRWLGFIGDTWTSVESLRGTWRLRDGLALPTEVARAWRLWLASHHAFFPLYSLLAAAYDQMVSARDMNNRHELLKWTRRSVDLNRGAGALLVLGMDFVPTMDIYEGHLRAEMPEGFSGYWLREAVVVAESRRAWTSGTGEAAIAAEARTVESHGRGIYDRYHRDIMRRSVADGRSLANKYRHANGCPHQIAAAEFDSYDTWFRVRRVALSRLGFINSTCRAVRLAVETVVTGSRLNEQVIGDLRAGLECALCVAAEWLGPLTEGSHFYPKSARGE